MRAWIAVAAVSAVSLVPALVAASPAGAAAPTCEGRPATIVGSPRGDTVEGTPGDDVIVSNGSYEVDAGDGDDLVCLTGHPTSQGDYPEIGVVAGPGDDRVVAVTPGPEDAAIVFLGEGADTFVGGPESDVVLGGEPDARDGSLDVDHDPDHIDTGGGYDQVEVGDGGPLADVVATPRGSSVTVHASGLADGGALQAGRASTLTVVDDEDGAWRLDAGARTATLAGDPRFTWRGFGSYVWAVPGTLDYVGTDGPDRITGPLVGATLGAGDDVAAVWSSAHDHRTTGTIDGGAGDDQVRLFAGRVDEAGGNGAVPFTPGDVTLDLPHRRGVFGGGVRLAITGFEVHGAQSDGSATITGTSGPDRLFGAACHLRVDAGAGDDVVHQEPGQGSSGLDSPDCHTVTTSHLAGGPGDDRVFGEATRNTLLGGSGDDHLFGSFWGTWLERGGPGDDVLQGGSGDDRLLGGAGRDRADGDAGDDTCVAEAARRCERVRGLDPTPPPPSRPRTSLLTDDVGDVEVATDPDHVRGGLEPSPSTTEGDLTSVRVSTRRGTVAIVSHLREVPSRHLLDLSIGLQHSDEIQFLYATVQVRSHPSGHPTAHFSGSDRSCATVAAIDRRRDTVTVRFPASCLGGSPWVRAAVSTLVTDRRSRPRYVGVDQAPAQHAQVGQYGPRAWLG